MNTVETNNGSTGPGAASDQAAVRTETLKARARELAREIDRATDEGERTAVVKFKLADETYAVETVYIREVCSLETLTLLPCAPAFVRGIINVHGQIMSVIDLRKLFGFEEEEIGDSTRVIVLQLDDMEFGVLADRVVGIDSLEMDRLQPPLPTMTGRRAEYVLGITGDRVVVLDGRRMVLDPQIVVNDDI